MLAAVTCFSYRWQSIQASTSLPSHASAISGRASKRPHHCRHMLQLLVAEHPSVHITTVTCFSYRSMVSGGPAIKYIFFSSKIKDAETSPRTCVSASFSQMIIARTLSDRRIRRSNRTAIGGRAEQDSEVSRAICALALCPVHFPYICVCSRPSRILCGASECI